MHTSSPRWRALIAEDEPLLAEALQQELARAWPALEIVACVGDGLSAVRESLALQPDVLFLDIRMPGQGGLDAAVALADAWPMHETSARPFPLLVFVTAYDQYAVRAFDVHALDYLLKPIHFERLQKTVQKVQQALASRVSSAQALEVAVSQLRLLLAAPGVTAMPTVAAAVAAPATPLTVIAASSGHQTHMVQLADVLVLEAADKYVRVLTAEREYLIRRPLRELAEQLDPQQFWQIHRGTLVRASAITTATRGDSHGQNHGDNDKLHVHLAGRAERWPVGRLYAYRFKAM